MTYRNFHLGPSYSVPESMFEDTVLPPDKADKVKVTEHTCTFHKKNPDKQYSKCTCSSAYKANKK